LKESIPPLFANESEAQFIEVIEAITETTLVATFVIPLLLRLVIKTAMSKVWSIFNTLQLITLLNLMALNLPSNVLAFHDHVNQIVNLNLELKEKVYGYIFGEQSSEVVEAQIKDQMLDKLNFSKDNFFESTFLIAVVLIPLALLIGLLVLLSKKCCKCLPEKVKKAISSMKHKLMFNSVFRSLLQSYLPLYISCLV